MIEQHFPGCGWIRLPRDTMDALLAYRSRRALPSWEATLKALLEGRTAADPPASDPFRALTAHHRKDGPVTVTAFAAETEERFALARQVADAVLFEGYVLYPYRASAAKNRLRWQFGVLVPPAWGAEREEHDFQHTECLMEPKAGATLAVEVRFLHARRRTVQRVRPDGGFDTVPELHLDDRVLVPWDEGVEERVEVVVAGGRTASATASPSPSGVPAREETEPVLDAAGRTVGRLVRRCEEISGTVRLSAPNSTAPTGRCG